MFYRILALLLGLTLAACETAPGDSENAVQPASSSNATYVDGNAPTSVSSGSQSDLEQNVGDRVFFSFDSSRLSDAAQQTLQRQAAWLNRHSDVNITLEGHCDERGTRAYNLALGERRANAAKDYLVSLGVAPARLSVISYGKERPAVSGGSERSWAQNRRAVTVVSY